MQAMRVIISRVDTATGGNGTKKSNRVRLLLSCGHIKIGSRANAAKRSTNCHRCVKETLARRRLERDRVERLQQKRESGP